MKWLSFSNIKITGVKKINMVTLCPNCDTVNKYLSGVINKDRFLFWMISLNIEN
jgi:hypothetical protein